MPQRTDSREIADFIEKLGHSIDLRGERQNWPGHLFHVTAVEHAARILADDSLLSRAEALRLDRLCVDNASGDIIDGTDPEVHQHARMYFRPKAPTFHNNEGIRPPAHRRRESHCAVPVALVFRQAAVLSRDDALISAGSLAKRRAWSTVERGNGVSFLRSLPFDRIYRSGSVRRDDKDDAFWRQAEVIVPTSMPVAQYLLGAFARSSAELEMLRHLLMREAPNRFAELDKKLFLNRKPGLFFKHWAFIRTVVASKDVIYVEFNSPAEETVRYSANATLDSPAGRRQTWEYDEFSTAQPLRLRLPIEMPLDRAVLTVSLSNTTAYVGPVQQVNG